VKAVSDLASADSIAIVSANPQIQTLKLRLADLQRQKAQLSERYGERHPEMVKVNASLTDAQRQLELETDKTLQAVKNDYDRAVLEERTLSANLEQAKLDVQDLSRKSVAYNVMEREARSNRTVCSAPAARERAARVEQQPLEQRARDRSRRDTEGPDGARRPPDLVAVARRRPRAGGRGGLRPRLHERHDQDARGRDPPPEAALPRPRAHSPQHQAPALGSTHARTILAKRFKPSTSLNARFGESTRTMLVTSAQPLEAKTTTACNIALALAYGGARVLLVDADMRRPGCTDLCISRTTAGSHGLEDSRASAT
jgi:hypothetical protein